MACDPSIPRPINSFIDYFNDIKPYHTKILEVIEQYLFKEDMLVTMDETMNLDITLENTPLCKGVGFGLDFDDECGFDALDCCDLFDCAGGFGLIFDNSDMLLEVPVLDIQQGQITIEGYHLYDDYINIKSVPNNNTIVLDGDYSHFFNNHKMFWVVRRNTYEIVDQADYTITVSGNVSAQVIAKNNIEIQNSGINDGHYGVIDATFNSGNTIITLNRKLEATSTNGRILVSSSTKNNGMYQIINFVVQNGETHLELAPNTPAPLTDSDVNGIHGAIRLRTGVIPMRRVWLGESVKDYDNDTEWRVTHTFIDTSGNTIILIDGTITESYTNPTLRIYGYESGAGFDGNNECSIPKPFNIHTYFSERLEIEIEDMSPPLPSPPEDP